MGMSSVNSAGAVLSVERDDSDGEPLLLLHGGPGVPDYMRGSHAALLPEFQCITFDQRGVGLSTCSDGRFDLGSYLEDLESVRMSFGYESWNVLGHSWGGLLAQAYTWAFPDRVSSLALSSSSLGVGHEWKQTKRESFQIEHRRAGLLGTARFYAYGSGLVIPGPIGAWAMRHVMTETWHNYFVDPRSAPDADPKWIAGCSPTAMMKTDRAISREHPGVLGSVSTYRGPVLVLYGEWDIFASGREIVRSRYPNATQVTLQDSGHVHWLQNPSGYAGALRQFYELASHQS
ncbi:MAG: alpha/beta hydrolase [Acidimicrobiales bacterium]|jgi:proline iminopeptidase